MPENETYSSEATIKLPKKNADALYLYFDESGNLDFKASGTPFFIMTCAATKRPFALGYILGELKYDLIETGLDIDKFHACEDRKDIRETIYAILSHTSSEYNVYSIYVDKRLVPDEFKSADAIYSKVFELIFDEVYERESNPNMKCVVAITDRLPKDAVRRQVTKPLKRYMKQKFQNKGIPYHLMHHDSASDMNLQAADYFCWAAQRDLAQGKNWPMTMLYRSFVEIGTVSFDNEEGVSTKEAPTPTTQPPI